MDLKEGELIEDDCSVMQASNGEAFYYHFVGNHEDYMMFTLKGKKAKCNYKQVLKKKKSRFSNKIILVNIADGRIKRIDSEYLQSVVRGINNPDYNKVEYWYVEGLVVDDKTVKIQQCHEWQYYRHRICEECGLKDYNSVENDQHKIMTNRCNCEIICEIKKIQKFAKRKIASKKLLAWIPDLVSIFYSPGCLGAFQAKNKFESDLDI